MTQSILIHSRFSDCARWCEANVGKSVFGNITNLIGDGWEMRFALNTDVIECEVTFYYDDYVTLFYMEFGEVII